MRHYRSSSSDLPLGCLIPMLIAILLILFIVYPIEMEQNRQKIIDRVTSEGYMLIESDYVSPFEHTPFFWYTKYNKVYRFTYQKDDQVYIGWVKFGSFGQPEWQMDYKEE